MPSRSPNTRQSASATLTTDIPITCSKTLECPTAVKNQDDETKGENLPALPATCNKPPTQTGECKTSRCAGGKPRQHKDVKGSVNLCSLSLCRCNTKHSHTLARHAFKLTLYLIGHFTALCFTEHGSVRNMSHERRLCERRVKTT